MDIHNLIPPSSPFDTTPNLRFFYTNAHYTEGYRRLSSALRAREGLLLLTGEPGTGKTTFLYKLSADLNETAHITYLPCAATTFQEILSYLCERCSLSPQSSHPWTQLSLLHDYLQSWDRHGGLEALFIDEAQHLSMATLDQLYLLMNLKGQNGKLLQIILSGHPEIEQTLSLPELRHVHQGIATHCQLRPLAAQEVGSFIRHRLHVVQSPRLDLFTSDAEEAIAQYSGGIPRLINIICDAALFTAARAGLQMVTGVTIAHVVKTLQLPSSFSPHLDQVSSREKSQAVIEDVDPEPLPSSYSSIGEVREKNPDSVIVTRPIQLESIRRQRGWQFVRHWREYAIGLSLMLMLAWLSAPPPTLKVSQIDPSFTTTFPEERPLLSPQSPLPAPAANTPASLPESEQTPSRHDPSAATPVTLPPPNTSVSPEQKTPSPSMARTQQDPQALSSSLFASSSQPFSRAAESPPAFETPRRASPDRQEIRTASRTSTPSWSIGKLDAHVRAPSGKSPADTRTLLKAADHGSVDTVDRLLQAGVSPNSQNARGWTALMFAVRGNSLDLVELLLARGARPDMKNETGTTALMIAAQHNRAAITQALLRRGATVDLADRQGRTALMHAAEMGHAITVRTLLNNGANPRVASHQGWTAAMYANRRRLASIPPPQFRSTSAGFSQRFGQLWQQTVTPDKFDEVLTLLSQAERRPYAQQGRLSSW